MPGAGSLCGSLKYTADFGALDSSVIYNMPTKKFTIYSEDASLMTASPYEYCVTSEFINYPGYGMKTGCGYVTLVNPCANPTSLVVGVPQNALSDYVNPAVFTFPTPTVLPHMCIDFAVYTCSFVGGPDGWITINDMCNHSYNNGVVSSSITFDSDTGSLVF